MSHAPQRGGQASDQATSGGQAGTGSNRRTDQDKSTHAERRASAYEGHVHRHRGQPEHQAGRSPSVGNVDYNAAAERTITTQQLLCTHSQCILCGLAVEERSDAELYGAGRASLLVAWCLGRGVRLCRPLRPRGSQGEHVEQVERGTYDGYRSGRPSGSPSSGRGLLRLMVAAGVVAGVRSCDRRPAQRHPLSASPATVGALLGQCRWSMQ